MLCIPLLPVVGIVVVMFFMAYHLVLEHRSSVKWLWWKGLDNKKLGAWVKQQLNENFEKQVTTLKEISQLVIAMNLKYNQLVSKSGERDHGDALSHTSPCQQFGIILFEPNTLGLIFLTSVIAIQVLMMRMNL